MKGASHVQSLDYALSFLIISICAVFLIIVVGWVTKYFVAQELMKNIERFRRTLKSESEAALEEFRSSLQSQKQMLNDSISGNLAKLHMLLVDSINNGRTFAAALNSEDYALMGEKARNMAASIKEFDNFYNQTSLFYSEPFCKKLSAFCGQLQEILPLFSSDALTRAATPKEREARRKDLHAGWCRFEDKVPTIMGLMKKELRSLVVPGGAPLK